MNGWIVLGVIGALMTFTSFGLLALIIIGELRRDWRRAREQRRRPGFISPNGDRIVPRERSKW